MRGIRTVAIPPNVVCVCGGGGLFFLGHSVQQDIDYEKICQDLWASRRGRGSISKVEGH
jgi:hypothetical protein